MANENESARDALKAERGAIPSNRQSTHEESAVDEEIEDMGDLDDGDDTDEKSDDTVDEKTDEESDEDEDSDEDDKDSTETSKKKSRHIPISEHKDKLREKETIIETLTREKDEAMALVDKFKESLPDDISSKIDEAVKQAGLADKDGSTEGVTKFFTELAKTIRAADADKIGNLEKTVNSLLEQTQEKEQVSKLNQEWTSFEGTFKNAYPDATPEQVKEASKLMKELATTEDIGGKTIIVDGKKALDPYEFDYIFYKQKKRFDDIIGSETVVKKHKGPQSGRTQPITTGETKAPKLNKNSTPSQIRARERELMGIEQKNDVSSAQDSEF